ncbi:MAG: NADH:flavin oxidoreductase/NADH oxidase [Idiomarina sp.]|nr:NADH:flavin oxidoreductase/NADH oxidase [Idiomarina sp.]
MSALFSSFRLKDVTLRNRIAVPPMCQYMAENGVPNDWHQTHYSSIARGGAGLVIVEATAVAPEGRITPHCTGLWNNEQFEAFKPIVKSIKKGGAVAGIQIAHAGRKASANRPWDGDQHIDQDAASGWETIAPSAVPFGANLPRTPTAMSKADIQRVQGDFVKSAERARDLGFEWLELHFAHGYLGQSFFSPLSNRRDDEYGGSFANRARFLVETVRAVRQVWPQNLPLTARFGVIEFDGNDEEQLKESVELTKLLKAEGLDFLSVSISFSTPEANIPWAPGFTASLAERIRSGADIPVASAWGLGEPEIAEKAVADKQMDIVMVGRAHLANPHWPYHAAKVLKVKDPSWVLPAPYAHWLERY